jgi:hypothetical protein
MLHVIQHAQILRAVSGVSDSGGNNATRGAFDRPELVDTLLLLHHHQTYPTTV